MGDALVPFATRHVETFNAAVESGDFSLLPVPRPHMKNNHPQGHPRCPTATVSDDLTRDCDDFVPDV